MSFLGEAAAATTHPRQQTSAGITSSTTPRSITTTRLDVILCKVGIMLKHTHFFNSNCSEIGHFAVISECANYDFC